MSVHFPVSGVEINPLIPLLVAFVAASMTAPAGVSGAFLLLPFQVSVLGFAEPAVSSTNLVYNVGATPGGIYRYIREGRMIWPLAWTVMLGTLPGVFAGAVLRITYLSAAQAFKVFVGAVLLYLGTSLLYETVRHFTRGNDSGTSAKREMQDQHDELLTFNKPVVFLLSLVVGVVGGIYGVGGAAMTAPFLVTVLGMPIRAVAGATLMGTLVTSVAGVAFFQILATGLDTGSTVEPDYLLGGVLAAGGLAGTYVGARAQKFLPESLIKAMLGALVLSLAGSYLFGAFSGG